MFWHIRIKLVKSKFGNVEIAYSLRMQCVAHTYTRMSYHDSLFAHSLPFWVRLNISDALRFCFFFSCGMKSFSQNDKHVSDFKFSHRSVRFYECVLMRKMNPIKMPHCVFTSLHRIRLQSILFFFWYYFRSDRYFVSSIHIFLLDGWNSFIRIAMKITNLKNFIQYFI